MKFNQWYSRILLVGLIWSLLALIDTTDGFLCGSHGSLKVQYDPKTQECKNKTVVPRATMPTATLSVCGSHGNVSTYDPTLAECKNETIVPFTTTSTISNKTTTKPTNPSSTTDPTTTRSCKLKEDVLNEGNCDKEHTICDGYECCGKSRVYHPDFQTCCKEMSKVVVYENSPEKDNICCGTLIYARNNPGCRHPALNDKLWGRHQRLGRRAYRDLCMANHVYLIDFTQKRDEIILWPINPTEKRLKLPFMRDNYSPTTRLPKTSMVLGTNKDLSKADDFIATSIDEFYTLRRHHKLADDFAATSKDKFKTIMRRRRKLRRTLRRKLKRRCNR